MRTDKILPIKSLKGEERYDIELVQFYPDTPTQSLTGLRLAALASAKGFTWSATLPQTGMVKDVPAIQLAPSTILVVGDTWTAILNLYKQELK